MNPAINMFDATGHAENFVAVVAHLAPHGSAFARAMHDPVRHAAQRHRRAVRKRCCFRQTAKTRGDPSAVTLCEVLGFNQISARRHGENGFAHARMNSQRVAACAAMTPQLNRVERRADSHREGARFGGTAVKQSAKSHVSGPGQQEFAGILPYPPPVKFIGAKTNHLPNIS